MKHKIKFIVFLLLISNNIIAQQAIQFDAPLPKNLTLKLPENQFRDSISLSKVASNLVENTRNQGFLEANTEQIFKKDSLYFAQIHIGKHYEKIALDLNQVPSEWLKENRIPQYKIDKPFNINELNKFKTTILDISNENSYPFAQVGVSDFIFTDNKAYAKLELKLKQKFSFGTIKMEGDTLISDAYLVQYLNYKADAPYRASSINEVEKRLQELNFLKQKSPFFVSFEGNKSTLHLDLEKKPSSRFDVLLGLQPNTETAGSTKLILSGNATIDLNNALKRGERFLLDFQRISPQIQQLKTAFSMPYLFNTPIGVDAKFEGYKRTNEYFNALLEGGILYQLSANQLLKGFWNRSSTTVLNIEKSAILGTRSLPQNIDVANNSYGLEWQIRKLDYKNNPRKGFNVKLKGGLGIKEILKNNVIVNLSDSQGYQYKYLYDSVQLKTTQYRIETKIETFIPLGKANNTLKVGLNAAAILGKAKVFKNEQFLLGGLKTLRGFDDESLLASQFFITTLEYRYLLSTNSYFLIFSDAAVLNEVKNVTQSQDNYLSFGSGIVFETRIGLLNIVYSLGKKNDNPFDFKTGKIHFGYFVLF